MLELYGAWSGGGLGGGRLPESGGLLEQAAVTMESIGIVAHALSKFQKTAK